jgi:hypothetical protein
LKFYTSRKVERNKKRSNKRRKKALIEGQLVGPLTIDDPDDQWLDLLITSDKGMKDEYG